MKAFAKPAAVFGRPARSASPLDATAAGHVRRVVARRRLLDVAPQVGLDVEDHRVPRRAGLGLLHEQPDVGPVGGHRAGVLQVVEVLGGLAGTGRGRALEHLVVREDRDHAVRDRVLDVPLHEVAAGVPGRPAVAGVHAAREVLVAETERGVGAEASGAAGRVGEPDLEAVERPSGREGGSCGAAARTGTGARPERRARRRSRTARTSATSRDRMRSSIARGSHAVKRRGRPVRAANGRVARAHRSVRWAQRMITNASRSTSLCPWTRTWTTWRPDVVHAAR